MNHSSPESSNDAPTLLLATRVWWQIGLLSFGGPAAQIALMHKLLVEQKRWLSEQQFLNALSFCMLLPGPEAMQLATYAGWRLHGTKGGLIAGLLFIIPGALVIAVLATVYALYGRLPLVEALVFGVKAAVLVIVIEALLRVAKKALTQSKHWFIALFSFVGIFFFSAPFPLIVVFAGLFGLLLTTRNPAKPSAAPVDVSASKTLATIGIWLCIWWLPVVALIAFDAPEVLQQVGLFFSKLAAVTFGGAYAVLAYMAQHIVEQLGWLSAGQMIDALGFAETTPGPLILVTQFVGFLAGFKQGGLLLGLSAAGVALWVTFAPCFLWIFAGAPYIERIAKQARLRGALQAITAAVVGVMLNLSLWFALHVLFAVVDRESVGVFTVWSPELASLQWPALTLTLISGVLAFRLHWGIIKILITSACLGAMLSQWT